MENVKFFKPYEKPFEIFGLYGSPETNGYCRIPEEVANATSSRVKELFKNTSGGRIRFKTDSDILVIRHKGEAALTYHATPALRCGYDVYIDRPQGSISLGCTKPEPFSIKEYEFTYNLGAGAKELTVYMPLYGNVRELFIGLRDGASLSAHSPYKYNIPVVFYGSSITQGACASRPGRAYEAIISRKYDLNFTNLGFSGACRAEKAIVEYMAGLPMSAFVSDYDHNAPTVEHLEKTHMKLFRKMRESHPTLPVIFMTAPGNLWTNKPTYQPRHEIIYNNYLTAKNEGDENVYFVDGQKFFEGEFWSECTVDGVHPNDLGFSYMAKALLPIIKSILKLN